MFCMLPNQMLVIQVSKYTAVMAIHVLYVTHSTNVNQVSKYTEVMAILFCVLPSQQM